MYQRGIATSPLCTAGPGPRASKYLFRDFSALAEGWLHHQLKHARYPRPSASLTSHIRVFFSAADWPLSTRLSSHRTNAHTHILYIGSAAAAGVPRVGFDRHPHAESSNTREPVETEKDTPPHTHTHTFCIVTDNSSSGLSLPSPPPSISSSSSWSNTNVIEPKKLGSGCGCMDGCGPDACAFFLCV